MSRVNPILRARIENGKVVWNGLHGKRWEAAKTHLEGAEVEITIQKLRKKSTAKQRQYYWPVIVALITQAAEYEPTDENRELVHQGLKWKFLRIVGGRGALETVRSTESLTTVEREQYHEHCRHFAATEYGLYIPLPNEVDDENWSFA